MLFYRLLAQTSFGVVCVVLMLLLGCGRTLTDRTSNRSMYYWKTVLDVDSTKKKLMDTLKIDHTYLRLFDVDWSSTHNTALPVSPLTTSYTNRTIFPVITPCIYVTNTVMEHISGNTIDTLAKQCHNKIIAQLDELATAYSEKVANDSVGMDKFYALQNTIVNFDSLRKIVDTLAAKEKNLYLKRTTDILIDCDWTVSTKETYFKFLEALKKLSPNREIQCTIRLWQYKNSNEAGVPPVNRGVLMCYNLRSPSTHSTINSIARQQDLAPYLRTDSRYPIKLDIALPVFSWGALFHGEAFRGLLNNATSQTFSDSDEFEQISDTRYRFKRDTVIGNIYIRIGDEIRIDQVSESELNEIIDELNNHLPSFAERRVGLFSLDAKALSTYSISGLNSFYNRTR